MDESRDFELTMEFAYEPSKHGWLREVAQEGSEITLTLNSGLKKWVQEFHVMELAPTSNTGPVKARMTLRPVNHKPVATRHPEEVPGYLQRIYEVLLRIETALGRR